MRKALLAALCVIIVGLMMVNGTFAQPDLGNVFQLVAELLDKGIPEQGGPGTAVQVALVADNQPQSLYPGSKVSRGFRVQNLGEGAVYFRLVYAVQYDKEIWPKLDIRFATGSHYTEHPWQDITIGAVPYKMKAFTYPLALPADGLSPEISISIAMDVSTNSKQIARLRSDFLQTQVLAIDPTPFTEKGYTTAAQALDLALPLDKLSPF